MADDRSPRHCPHCQPSHAPLPPRAEAMAKVLQAPAGGGGLTATMANVGQSLSSMGSALSTAYASAGAQAEAALAAFEKEHCTPASFTPSECPAVPPWDSPDQQRGGGAGS